MWVTVCYHRLSEPELSVAETHRLRNGFGDMHPLMTSSSAALNKQPVKHDAKYDPIFVQTKSYV